MGPEVWDNLLRGVLNLQWQSLVMLLAGLLLIWLAIVKEYEPLSTSDWRWLHPGKHARLSHAGRSRHANYLL